MLFRKIFIRSDHCQCQHLAQVKRKRVILSVSMFWLEESSVHFICNRNLRNILANLSTGSEISHPMEDWVGGEVFPPNSVVSGREMEILGSPNTLIWLSYLKSICGKSTFFFSTYVLFKFQYNHVRTIHTCNNMQGSHNHYVVYREPESKGTNRMIPSIW